MLFIYLMTGLHPKNNGLLPRILTGQKKHIRPFLLLDFKAVNVWSIPADLQIVFLPETSHQSSVLKRLLCAPLEAVNA